MGRKPNPLILEYFVRGPKLNDNSNRYPHTCKQCGENFPKGRIDSLTTHITKKCPAITESDRMRACLELHGINNARLAAERNNRAEGRINGQNAAAAALSGLPQGWSALETLAEASRQVDLNENNRVPKEDETSANPADPSPGGTDQQARERFELEEQFTLDNPPASYEGRVQGVAKKETTQPSTPIPELTPEERLQALLPSTSESPEPSNISVAVAAAARLNPSLLDPQLIHDDTTATSSPTQDTSSALDAVVTSLPDTIVSQPWGEMTYLSTAPPTTGFPSHTAMPFPLARGGIPMDTSDGTPNGRPRHSRARFTPARRKEVQEVRKIGACIRCRILRKNCGKGTPCDTCRKVLAPRVWRTGCVRSRLHEQLDLYSAGVQVVLSQNRINILKDQLRLINNGTVIEVSHFPESDKLITFGTLVVVMGPSESQAAARESQEPFPQTVMIDQETEDVPDKIEKYVQEVLPLFIEREPSNFMRVTLEAAKKQLVAERDDLLGKALELWSLVESIDRERQWSILEKPGAEDEKPRLVKEAHDANDADIYTMICMQLNAAAERKANTTSRSLLNLMDRLLTDSKTKVGFKMFLTAVIFLNCVEKSTWAFKAWEQDHLRPGWPLERDPSVFTQQGGHIAGLLKMLLAIRKAHPMTVRNVDGKLATEDTDPAIVEYFQNLDLDYDYVENRQKGPEFSPADSRSLELLYCSHLLLPNS